MPGPDVVVNATVGIKGAGVAMVTEVEVEVKLITAVGTEPVWAVPQALANAIKKHTTGKIAFLVIMEAIVLLFIDGDGSFWYNALTYRKVEEYKRVMIR